MNGDKTYAKNSGFTRVSHPANEIVRTIMLLAGLSVGVVVMVGIGFIVQMKLAKEPILSMKGLAPTISSQFFGDMLHMEIPGFSMEEDAPYTFSESNVLTFLAHLLTGVNPRDPKSLIAGELPGIREDIVQLRRSPSGGKAAAPADYAPIGSPNQRDIPAAAETPGPENISEANGGAPDQIADDPPPGQAEHAPEPSPDNGGPQEGKDGKPAASPPQSTAGRKVVMIYHSHNRESWFPELEKKGKKDIKYAEDAKTNITLVGRRLADQLERLGIGVLHSDTDYASTVKNYNWNFSYKYSQATVKTAMAEHRDLLYFFDIHRDSQHRELTTIEIGGKAYAQVYFVVGLSNPDWEKNEAFATRIHEALEARYPGISRGIWGKGKNQGNGEYNQSLSPNSLVIEIGGPENTLEESYRTADVLAGVIADLYWEAERVSSGG